MALWGKISPDQSGSDTTLEAILKRRWPWSVCAVVLLWVVWAGGLSEYLGMEDVSASKNLVKQDQPAFFAKGSILLPPGISQAEQAMLLSVLNTDEVVNAVVKTVFPRLKKQAVSLHFATRVDEPYVIACEVEAKDAIPATGLIQAVEEGLRVLRQEYQGLLGNPDLSVTTQTRQQELSMALAKQVNTVKMLRQKRILLGDRLQQGVAQAELKTFARAMQQESVRSRLVWAEAKLKGATQRVHELQQAVAKSSPSPVDPTVTIGLMGREGASSEEQPAVLGGEKQTAEAQGNQAASASTVQKTLPLQQFLLDQLNLAQQDQRLASEELAALKAHFSRGFRGSSRSLSHSVESNSLRFQPALLRLDNAIAVNTRQSESMLHQLAHLDSSHELSPTEASIQMDQPLPYAQPRILRFAHQGSREWIPVLVLTVCSLLVGLLSAVGTEFLFKPRAKRIKPVKPAKPSKALISKENKSANARPKLPNRCKLGFHLNTLQQPLDLWGHLQDPKDDVAVAFTALQEALPLSEAKHLAVFGSTVIAAGLAATLATSGKSVALLEINDEASSLLAYLLHVDQPNGLMNLMAGQLDLPALLLQAKQDGLRPNLAIIHQGTLSAEDTNPHEKNPQPTICEQFQHLSDNWLLWSERFEHIVISAPAWPAYQKEATAVLNSLSELLLCFYAPTQADEKALKKAIQPLGHAQQVLLLPGAPAERKPL